MALISCPECSKQVSSAAPQCPQCGYPLAKSDETTSTNPPRQARTTPRSAAPTFSAPISQQATHIVIHQPVKSHKGLARAAWILIFLVCGVALLPFLGFASWLVAGPVFFVTFILSIMVLSRGGTLSGILLLFTSIIGGPVFVTFAPFVSSFLGLGAAAKASIPKSESNEKAPLSNQLAGETIQSHLDKCRLIAPMRGNFNVVGGSFDWSKGTISPSNYNAITNLSQAGLITLAVDRDYENYKKGGSFSWDQWQQQTQGAVIAKISLSPTKTGLEFQSLGNPEWLQLPMGSFKVSDILQNEKREKGVNTYRIVMAKYNADWNPLFKKFMELSGQKAETKRKAMALLKWDMFNSTWIAIALDIADADQEFSTNNVLRTLESPDTSLPLPTHQAANSAIAAKPAPPPLTDYKEALSWNVQRIKLQAGSSWVRLAAKPEMHLQPFTLDPGDAEAFQQVRLISETSNGLRSKEISLAELLTSKASLSQAAFLYIRSDGSGRHQEIELRAEFVDSHNKTMEIKIDEGAPLPSKDISALLIGKWTSRNYNIASSTEYAANGTYVSIVGTSNHQEGSWRVDGNSVIHTWGDNKSWKRTIVSINNTEAVTKSYDGKIVLLKRETQVERPKSPEAGKSTQASGAQVDPDDRRKFELTNFVTQHHNKSSRGDVDGFIADYAEKVNHFDNGVVTRDFIRKDELEYHSPGTRVTETLIAPPQFERLDSDGVTYTASYSINFHRVRSDGQWSKGVSDVSLIIEVTKDGPLIVRQTAKARNIQKGR